MRLQSHTGMSTAGIIRPAKSVRHHPQPHYGTPPVRSEDEHSQVTIKICTQLSPIKYKPCPHMSINMFFSSFLCSMCIREAVSSCTKCTQKSVQNVRIFPQLSADLRNLYGSDRFLRFLLVSMFLIFGMIQLQFPA